ncbi:unnamed protein product [Mucor hiemalis]
MTKRTRVSSRISDIDIPPYEHQTPYVTRNSPFGRNFLQDIATEKVRQRFTTAYESDLNVELSRLLLDYYVLDIWSCLGTTSKYLNIEGISVRDFSSRNAILNRAKYNKKNGNVTINFVNMEHHTVRKYFEAIFPNDLTKITEAAKT